MSEPDLVYAVTTTLSGMLTASATASGTGFIGLELQVRPACPGAATTETACKEGLTTGSGTSLAFAVTAGSTYYVDVQLSTPGSFTLTLTL